MKVRLNFLLFLFFFAASAFAKIPPEEGMYPMSEINKLKLKEAGLNIDAFEIFNGTGNSLTNALVNLSGCTGSFVSADGLIITNHHCAFSAVAAVSSTEQNYLENGFWAQNREMEIAAPGMVCKITVSYEDVSMQVLSQAEGIEDPVQRLDAINKKIKQIEAQDTENNPGLEVKISEMFPGRNYVLFRYKTIKDVRLVYVPSRNIGEFGGETDNWVWPRHTGDFSFVRAYVAPDGSGAAFSTNNVPFKPSRFLKINPKGVQEEDFVFILGYPGRTYRNQPSQYLVNQREHVLPYISKVYDWQINYMENLGRGNEAKQLMYASQIKRLANTTKNFKGKMQGLNRVDIIANKQAEEAALQAFVNSKPSLKSKYGKVLSDIDHIYQDILAVSDLNLLLSNLTRFSSSYSIASDVLKAQNEVSGKSKAQAMVYLEAEKDKLWKTIDSRMGASYNLTMEKDFYKFMLSDLVKLNHSSLNKLKTAISSKGGVNAYVDALFAQSYFQEKEILKTKYNKSTYNAIVKTKDPFVDFVREVNDIIVVLTETNKLNNAKLNALLPLYADAKMAYKGADFIPDANSTLRFTYGYIRGYYPQDGEYHEPFTTLNGVIEKGMGAKKGEDYEMPGILRELHNSGNLGQFASAQLNDVPVAMLYNLDTTGGNSGSPVMNANGELVGVNFDRAFTATINDFAWNEAYSRSIAVDIRYVLFVLEKVDGANNILKELGAI